MTVVYNSTMNVRVNRTSIDELRAETSLLATDMEAVGWITTDVKGLIIKDAHYTIFRNAHGAVGDFPLPGLVGVEAFLNSGPELKRELGNTGQEIARELIAECVRGTVQAESFFFTERGYADAGVYDNYWEEMYAKSCRYYSHLDQVDQPWMEYVGYLNRCHNLFNRSKQITLSHDGKASQINGSFIDSFHELSLVLILDDRGVITKAEGNFLRAPAKICWENSSHLDKVIGSRLNETTKRDIAALAGGSEGCNHLVDLMYEAAKAAKKAINTNTEV